jgi:hypothetical protein
MSSIAGASIQTQIPDAMAGMLCCRRKDKTHVVTDHPIHSGLAAIWARRAGAFPFERP